MSIDRSRRAGRAVVVGREEVVAPFRAAGLESAAVDPADAATRVRELVAAGYAVIFYTADLARSLEALVQAYSSSPEPSLVELPTGNQGGGAVRRMREVVKRAAGVDVFSEAKPASEPGGRL